MPKGDCGCQRVTLGAEGCEPASLTSKACWLADHHRVHDSFNTHGGPQRKDSSAGVTMRASVLLTNVFAVFCLRHRRGREGGKKE